MLSHFHLYRELRFSVVMGRRYGLLGLREDDDDDVHHAIIIKTLHEHTDA